MFMLPALEFSLLYGRNFLLPWSSRTQSQYWLRTGTGKASVRKNPAVEVCKNSAVEVCKSLLPYGECLGRTTA